MVIGALLALSTWLGAAPIGAENRDSDSAIGVAVPGLTVTTVSGEAFGGDAEFSFFVSVGAGSDGAAVTSIDRAALLQAIQDRDIAALNAVLESAGISVAGDVGASQVVVVDEHAEAKPDPEVELPASGGGPIKDSENALKAKFDDGSGDFLLIAEDLAVATEGWPGDTGWARAEAKAEDVEGFLSSANKVETECRADLSGVKGDTRIDEGEYGDFDVDDELRIPVYPDENEELVDTDETFTDGSETVHVKASLDANVQDKDEHAVTVTGLVERFSLVVTSTVDPDFRFELKFEMDIAKSHCDVHPDPVAQVVVVEPTFTG